MALLKFKVYTQDKTNHSRFFNIGEEVEISDEKRVAYIVSQGLADVVEDEVADAEGAVDTENADEVDADKAGEEDKTETPNEDDTTEEATETADVVEDEVAKPKSKGRPKAKTE